MLVTGPQQKVGQFLTHWVRQSQLQENKPKSMKIMDQL
jgi:hypothetical protein